MSNIDLAIWLSVLWIIDLVAAHTNVPYNSPRSSSCVSWSSTPVTFANNTLVAGSPHGFFVNTNNTLSLVGYSHGKIQIWPEGSNVPSTTTTSGGIMPCSLFVTVKGDIYVDNGQVNHTIDKWAWNATSSISVMSVTDMCYGLFIDINNALYCSMGGMNQVVKRLLNDSTNTVILAAGNGTAGMAPNMLHYPNGIFVDLSLNLYVADSTNNRIQKFSSEQLNETTVAGNGSSSSFTLHAPSGVVFDADSHLFILGSGHQRVIRSGPTGYQCVVECSNTNGSTSQQLINPWTLNFVSYGNIFVPYMGNGRIQKFILSMNSCAPSITEDSRSFIMSIVTSQNFQYDNTTDLPFIITSTSNVHKCQIECLVQAQCQAASFQQSVSTCNLFSTLPNRNGSMLVDKNTVYMIIVPGTRLPSN